MARLVQSEFGCGYQQALQLVRAARETGLIGWIRYPADREIALTTLKQHYEFELVDPPAS